MIRTSRTIRLILAFAALNILVVASSGLLWFLRNRPVVEGDQWVRHSIRVQVQLGVILSQLIDVETGERGFIITGDPAFLEPFDRSILDLDETLAELGREIADNPVQLALLSELQPKVQEKLSSSRAAIAMRREHGLEAATYLVIGGQGKQRMDALRNILGFMIAEENRLLSLRGQARATAVSRLAFTMYLMSGLLIFMSLGFTVILVAGTRLRDRLLETFKLVANIDPLTALPNRRLLQELGEASCLLARRQGLQAAVLYLDLDGFKAVNDRFGHARGDQLLQEVGRRLKDCVRDSDTIARMGGDEFVILLPEVSGLEGATAVADKVLESLKAPYHLGGIIAEVTASIGLAFLPQHGLSMESLLNAADRALYQAKHGGRNQYRMAQEWSGRPSAGRPSAGRPSDRRP